MNKPSAMNALPKLPAASLALLLAAPLFAVPAVRLEADAERKEEQGRSLQAQKIWVQAGEQRLKEAEIIVVKGEKP